MISHKCMIRSWMDHTNLIDNVRRRHRRRRHQIPKNKSKSTDKVKQIITSHQIILEQMRSQSTY